MTAAVALFLGTVVAALAVALARVRNLFSTLALLSALSGFVVVTFSLLGAVDVAFMEAVVGVAVSTMFLMALLRRVDATRVSRRSKPGRLLAALVAAAVGGALLVGVSALPKFGDPMSPASMYVSSEYIERSVEDMRTPNVVTAVLADYRGFDTLVETAVVLTAAVACVLLLGRRL